MSEHDEPRELTVVQKFWDGNQSTTRDFRANIVKIEDEAKEVEETITPAPKDESAQGSADSQPEGSTVIPTGEPATQPQSSVTPVLTDGLTPTEKLEAAVAASGSDSNSSEDEPPLPLKVVPTPSDESSSQSSSSETSPGKSEPPVAAPPPPAAPSLPPTPPQTSQ